MRTEKERRQGGAKEKGREKERAMGFGKGEIERGPSQEILCSCWVHKE